MSADPTGALAATLSVVAGAELELERPGEPEYGDYATNVALRLASVRRRPPRELAAEIAEAAARLEDVERAEIAGPGFVNLFLRDDWFAGALAAILGDGDGYGGGSAGELERVQVEMVSANPTGPIPVSPPATARTATSSRACSSSRATRSSASTTTTTRVRRWSGSGRRSRRAARGGAVRRTAIRAPTSRSLRRLQGDPVPLMLEGDRVDARTVPHPVRRLAAAERARGAAAGAAAATRHVRARRRALGAVFRLRRRRGPRPRSARATARRHTAPRTSPTSWTSSNAASTAPSTCSAQTTTAPQLVRGRGPDARLRPRLGSRCFSTSSCT